MRKLIVLLMLILLAASCEKRSEEEIALEKTIREEKRETLMARGLCKKMIRDVSRNPPRVTIPQHDMKNLGAEYIAPFRNGKVAEFHWTGTHKVRIPNGFGGMEPVDVICEYDIESDKIVTFTIDGEDVI